jgi:hypothetical protein
VEIRSSAGSFFASAVGRGLYEVTDRLLDQMRRRLKRWKMKEESYDTSVA